MVGVLRTTVDSTVFVPNSICCFLIRFVLLKEERGASIEKLSFPFRIYFVPLYLSSKLHGFHEG